jgi:enoyl-CoA hydratase/carnithine racemase
MVSAEQMKFEVSDRVATITFDRPDKMNAWTPVMESELRRLMAIASEDEDVRAIVITGAGRGFCAGADMGRLSDGSSGIAAAAAPVVPPVSDDDLAQRYSYLLAVPSRSLRASMARSRALVFASRCIAISASWPQVRS